MVPRFSMQQVMERVGLDEAELRYFESSLKEFLAAPALGAAGLKAGDYTEDQIALLGRVKDLVYKHGYGMDEVRKEFRGAALANGAGAERMARVIAVTSGKGGVGKTSLTVNLAVAMAKAGKRVGIFDADLGLANVHILMGIRPKFNLSHVLQDGFRMEDIVAEGPYGIKIVSGGQGVREMANLDDDQRRGLLRQIDKLEREVDVLIVDTGAGIGENVLRFATFADEIIAVTTPNMAANADCFSTIKILLEMEPRSRIGLVTNQVRDMYEAKNTYNRLSSACRQNLKYELNDLGHVTDCARMRAANQERRTLTDSEPDAPASLCIARVLETLDDGRVFANREKDRTGFGELLGALKRTMAPAGTKSAPLATPSSHRLPAVTAAQVAAATAPAASRRPAAGPSRSSRPVGAR